jgi:hypothetical protein
LGDCRYLLECHTGRLQHEGRFTCANVLGKTAHAPQDVSKDFISRSKSRDALADHFNAPGYVRPKNVASRPQQPA